MEDTTLKPVRPRAMLMLLRDLGRTIHLIWQTNSLYTCVIVGITIIQGIIPVAQLWVWKLLFDTFSSALTTSAEFADTFRTLMSLLGMLGGFYVANGVLGTLHSILQQLLGELLQYRISLLILKKANSLEIAFFEDARFYDKLQNAHQEAGYRPMNVLAQILSVGQSLITLSSMIVLLANLSWAIVLIIFITALPDMFAQNRYGYANYWMLRQRAPETRKQQYLGFLLTTNWTIKEIRSFRVEKHLVDILQSQFAKFFAGTRALGIKRGIAGLAAALISTLGWFVANSYVIFRAAQRSITIGDLTLYTQAIAQTQGHFQSILSGLSSLYTDMLFIHNLFEFLAQPARDLSAGRTWAEPIHEIEFRNISFCYPGTKYPVLENINFVIQRGQPLALIGKNGAGKTTLIKLLCRLYEPTTGKIFVNGKDISEYSPQSVQEHIAVIFQDYGHYEMTAQENIGLGRTSHMNDSAAIEAAARSSGADSIIDPLPAKYQTVLGRWFENGHELSTGQWQKVALARAYLRDGSVMILDEPTAALDAEAEYETFESLKQKAMNQITILVSHRFSTVRLVDHIILLDQGRILEAGSHTELMSKNGRYAHLFRLQAHGYGTN